MLERILEIMVITMFEKLVDFLLRNVKVDKKALQEAVDRADYDGDGCINLGEFIRFLRDTIGFRK